MKTSISRRIGRYVVLPIVSAGLIGAHALAVANASPTSDPHQDIIHTPDTREGFVAAPETKADPAAEAEPGSQWHRHHQGLAMHEVLAHVLGN